MPIYMPARGVSQHQKSLNFKNVSNRSDGGGGSVFFKNVSNSKMSQMSEGGGGANPSGDIVPNFTVFFSDASPNYNGCILVCVAPATLSPRLCPSSPGYKSPQGEGWRPPVLSPPHQDTTTIDFPSLLRYREQDTKPSGSKIQR